MTRRLSIPLVAVAVFVAACSPSESADTSLPTTTTSSTSTTSTTIPPTTTTTTPAVRIENGPPALIAAIETFYDYAAGRGVREPNASPGLVALIEPSDVRTPIRGSASVAEFKEQPIAVAKVGRDTFLAVKPGARWKIVGGEWPSLSIPAFFGRGPRVLAVVGSDARPGQTVETSRADSIHFVGLDGKGGGGIVGLPRDSWVDVPGFGTGKITTSLSLGGPDTMMEAFTQLTDLRFEGYVLTGFGGFEELLGSVLGGVTVDVPFSISDRWAHVDIGSGEQLLDGAEALGFARARKTVPNGDFTRSEHQGMILLAAARAVRGLGLTALPGLLEMSEPHIITDLSPAQLLTFSAMAVTAKLNSVENVVAPGSPGSAGAASVVYLSGSVDELFDDLADGALESD